MQICIYSIIIYSFPKVPSLQLFQPRHSDYRVRLCRNVPRVTRTVGELTRDVDFLI